MYDVIKPKNNLVNDMTVFMSRLIIYFDHFIMTKSNQSD